MRSLSYIYDKCLNTLPENFNSKDASRYLTAIELLSDFTYAKEKLSYVVTWLMKNLGEDGLWDMGTSVKDNILYPLSDSWRNLLNRKTDCTVRIMSLLNKMECNVN